jgi:hypothetical protein
MRGNILISVQCHLITNVRLLLLYSFIIVYIDILIQRIVTFCALTQCVHHIADVTISSASAVIRVIRAFR